MVVEVTKEQEARFECGLRGWDFHGYDEANHPHQLQVVIPPTRGTVHVTPLNIDTAEGREAACELMKSDVLWDGLNWAAYRLVDFEGFSEYEVVLDKTRVGAIKAAWLSAVKASEDASS